MEGKEYKVAPEVFGSERYGMENGSEKDKQ